VAHHQPHLLFGEDNLNGGFTTHRSNNIEIGLRTKLRYPLVENEYNSNGDGTYTWPTIDCFGEPSDCKIPHWSMEFSVATFGDHHVGDYCWELGMDADPSLKMDFTTFDPISQSYEAAFFDHSFGDLDSAESGNSIYKLGNDCTASISAAQFCQRYYRELLGNTILPKTIGTMALPVYQGRLSITSIAVLRETTSYIYVPWIAKHIKYWRPPIFKYSWEMLPSYLQWHFQSRHKYLMEHEPLIVLYTQILNFRNHLKESL